MEPDGIDALLQRAAVDGAEPPTPIRMQPNPAAAPASAAAATGRRTKKKTKAARRAAAAPARAGSGVTKLPVPPSRRETARRRPASAGRRTRPSGGSPSGRSASARRVQTRSPEEDLLAVVPGAEGSWRQRSSGAGGAPGVDQRVAAPAWQDTEDEAQLDVLRAVLDGISTAESELEEIRRQDEAHMRAQDEARRAQREQVERLEKAELRIQELAASSGAPDASQCSCSCCPPVHA